MNERRTFRILGAGPAGLAGAIRLAHAGHDVEVFERKGDVGARFVGDLHGVENWTAPEDFREELSRLGLEASFDCDPVSELLLTDGSRLDRLSFRRPLFYLVRRGNRPGCLDQGLKEQALAAGVRIHFGANRREDEVDLVATGPRPDRTFVVEKGILFRTAAADVSVGLVHERAAVRGYAYLLVWRGWGCLCTVLFDHFERAARCLDEARRLFANVIDFDVRDPKSIGGYGAFSVPCDFGTRGRPRTGEAAGLQDLVWGFGIRSALASGALAGGALHDDADWAEIAGRDLVGTMRASVVGRFLWEAFAGRGFPLFTRLMRSTADPARWLEAAYRPSVVHRMLYRPSLDRLNRRFPAAGS